MSSCSSKDADDFTHNDEMSSSSPLRVPPFVPDQRVFATDESSGDLYEAVIRKASWTGHHWTFLVHYLGWNSRWDRVLEETKVFPNSAEVRSKAMEQQEKQQKDKKRKSRDEDTVQSSSSRKKRVDRGPTFAEYCELPFTLKTILVEDREKIMRLGFDAPRGFECEMENWRPARDVHHLPARVTVKTVLDHYVKCKTKENKAFEPKARAFVEELAQLFDSTLAVCLLYQPERAQHLAIQAHPELSQLRKCEIYGCEFLLRFLVRLPVLLEEANNGKDRKEVGSQLADLIVLLQKNRQACFKAKYREPKEDELNDYEKALRDGAAPVAMDE